MFLKVRKLQSIEKLILDPALVGSERSVKLALLIDKFKDEFKAAGAGFKGLMGGAPEITRMEVVG